MNDWIACFDKETGCSLHESGKCRFEHDHLNIDGNAQAIMIDGLILNQKELFDQYQTTDFLNLVLKMRQAKPKDFFNDFRGPFTGLYYDKCSGDAVVFTNQTGDSAVFYYLSDRLQAFSSNYNMLLDFLKEHQIPVTLDEKAANWMLTFGYLIDDATFTTEIKRLRAGKADRKSVV